MKFINFCKNLVYKVPFDFNYNPIHYDDVSFKLITYKDIMNYELLRKRKLLFRWYLAKGQVGFMLIDNTINKCIGYGWSSINKPKLGHKNIFKCNYAWFHTDYIDKSYRGKRYYKYLMLKRIEFIRNQNKEMDIYIDTHYNNVPAIKTHLSLNLKEAGIYNYLSLGTLRLPYCYLGIGKWYSNKKHSLVSK